MAWELLRDVDTDQSKQEAEFRRKEKKRFMGHYKKLMELVLAQNEKIEKISKIIKEKVLNKKDDDKEEEKPEESERKQRKMESDKNKKTKKKFRPDVLMITDKPASSGYSRSGEKLKKKDKKKDDDPNIIRIEQEIGITGRIIKFFVVKKKKPGRKKAGAIYAREDEVTEMKRRIRMGEFEVVDEAEEKVKMTPDTIEEFRQAILDEMEAERAEREKEEEESEEEEIIQTQAEDIDTEGKIRTREETYALIEEEAKKQAEKEMEEAKKKRIKELTEEFHKKRQKEEELLLQGYIEENIDISGIGKRKPEGKAEEGNQKKQKRE